MAKDVTNPFSEYTGLRLGDTVGRVGGLDMYRCLVTS